MPFLALMSAIDAAAEPGRFLGRQCMIQDNKQTFSESSKLAEALGVNFDDDYDPPQDGDKGIIRARIADWNGEIVVAVYVPVTVSQPPSVDGQMRISPCAQ